MDTVVVHKVPPGASIFLHLKPTTSSPLPQIVLALLILGLTILLYLSVLYLLRVGVTPHPVRGGKAAALHFAPLPPPVEKS